VETVEDITMKKCKICKKELPATLEYFYKSKSTKDGLNNQCNECKAKHDKKQYELRKQYHKDKYQDNKEYRLYQISYAIKVRGYLNLTTEHLKTILANFKNKSGISVCPYCNREMTDDTMIHFDHFIPYHKTKGIQLNLTNLIPVCKYCNRSKERDDFIEWYRDQLFYDKKREKQLLKYVENNKLVKFFK